MKHCNSSTYCNAITCCLINKCFIYYIFVSIFMCHLYSLWLLASDTETSPFRICQEATDSRTTTEALGSRASQRNRRVQQISLCQNCEIYPNILFSHLSTHGICHQLWCPTHQMMKLSQDYCFQAPRRHVMISAWKTLTNWAPNVTSLLGTECLFTDRF